MKADPGNIRKEYLRSTLDESTITNDPIDAFEEWLEQAVISDCHEPTAMMVATAGADGRVSSRMVLLKGVGKEGFQFFTNFESRKAKDLESNPHAALLFFWPELERQVRIEGKVEKLSSTTSDRYFSERPRGSQLGAWASKQSSAIESRKSLDEEYAFFENRFKLTIDVPRPNFWGGYRLQPDRIEFWQGRKDRLHDRVEFALEDGKWIKKRLCP
jgi:pyridoxamine 5'-phosphate oxidase